MSRFWWLSPLPLEVSPQRAMGSVKVVMGNVSAQTGGVWLPMGSVLRVICLDGDGIRFLSQLGYVPLLCSNASWTEPTRAQ